MKKKKRVKMKFKFYKNPEAKGHKLYWKIVACNGNTLGHSEMYLQKHGATKTVNSIISAIQKGEFKIEKRFIET